MFTGFRDVTRGRSACRTSAGAGPAAGANDRTETKLARKLLRDCAPAESAHPHAASRAVRGARA